VDRQSGYKGIIFRYIKGLSNSKSDFENGKFLKHPGLRTIYHKKKKTIFFRMDILTICSTDKRYKQFCIYILNKYISEDFPLQIWVDTHTGYSRNEEILYLFIHFWTQLTISNNQQASCVRAIQKKVTCSRINGGRK